MSHTNATTHYALSQFISTDTPGWMSDVNGDNVKIDTAIYNNAQDISNLDSSVGTLSAKVTAMLPDAGTTGSVLQKTAMGATWSNLFDLIYPIGSIYMTEDANFNPSTTFGGSWSRIQDRFLLAAGATYNSGDVGGEASHILTIPEMPEHGHDMTFPGTGGTATWGYTWQTTPSAITHDPNNPSRTGMGTRGSGEPHNNMPPYLVVNIWKRVA